MKQRCRSAIKAELDMKDQEDREEAAELAELEASYTELERAGYVDSNLFDSWAADRQRAADARSDTLAGKDENGEPFKTTTDYFWAVRTLGWLTPEERATYECVRDKYRDQDLLVAFGVSVE